MAPDPFNPFGQGKGNAEFRRLQSRSNRTPEEFERDREVSELLRQRRRDRLRRLFRRGK